MQITVTAHHHHHLTTIIRTMARKKNIMKRNAL